MKAYQANNIYDDIPYSKIVYADTANKAKMQSVGLDELDNPSYMEINVRRAKWADDKENLNEFEMIVLELQNGWFYDLEQLDESSRLCEEDVPRIKEAGYTNMVDLYQDWKNGKFKTANEL